jgi:hypothetical protein
MLYTMQSMNAQIQVQTCNLLYYKLILKYALRLIVKVYILLKVYYYIVRQTQ